MTGKRQHEPRYDAPDLPRRHVSKGQPDAFAAGILADLQQQVADGEITEAQARAEAIRCGVS